MNLSCNHCTFVFIGRFKLWFYAIFYLFRVHFDYSFDPKMFQEKAGKFIFSKPKRIRNIFGFFCFVFTVKTQTSHDYWFWLLSRRNKKEIRKMPCKRIFKIDTDLCVTYSIEIKKKRKNGNNNNWHICEDMNISLLRALMFRLKEFTLMNYATGTIWANFRCRELIWI